jgi:Ser/Thr protein kinase RdoA (MazF antagonist)
MSELINSFYSLDPITILDALESIGIATTGRFLQLNSLENRVYEVELEITKNKEITDRFIVTKFYRPERWSFNEIQDEHNFLKNLSKEDIPVITPYYINEKSLFNCPKTNIIFSIFPKFSGRNPDEFSDQEVETLGRLFARLHQVGAREKALFRKTLNIENMASEYLTYLSNPSVIPEVYFSHIYNNWQNIIAMARPFMNELKIQRIHADAHRANLIKRNDSFYWLDFDDFLNGPAVQDLWLLFSGRDSYNRKKLEKLVFAYQEIRDFNFSDLYLIEPLRCLRVLHFNVWIHKRWDDPYFKKTFDNFATSSYWNEQSSFFAEQLSIYREILESGNPLLTI